MKKLLLIIVFTALINVNRSNTHAASGNPEKVAAGQQTITGAVIGLLVIILSVVILRLVRVVIIQIPGF